MFYYFVYKTTNLINLKYYYGVHKTKNLNDGYLGSGKRLGNSIKFHGAENFNREIVQFCSSYEEALKIEKLIVTEELVNSKECYNMCLGGGKPPTQIKEDHWAWGIKRPDSSKRMKENNPSRLDHVKEKSKNTVIVKDREGNRFRVKKDDPRYISGDLTQINKNKVTVKNKDGEIFQTDINDPLFISGECIHISKGTVIVKDREGNNFRVYTGDERLRNGSVEHVRKGIKGKPWSKERKEKYLSNPRSAWNKGLETGKRDPEIGKKISDSNKGKTHEKVTCPHCLKDGSKPAMVRWHFNNCKRKTDE